MHNFELFLSLDIYKYMSKEVIDRKGDYRQKLIACHFMFSVFLSVRYVRRISVYAC